MTETVRIVGVAILLVVPLTASAHGRRGARTPTAYYYPAPVFYQPVAPLVAIDPCWLVPPVPVAVPAVAPPPAPPARLYATPVPAPPSTGPAAVPAPSAPPASSPAPAQPMTPAPPAVSESRSFYSGPPASSPAGAVSDRAHVGFWNLAGREVALQVEGRTYWLAQGQRLKLDVGREFVWKDGDHETQRERLPAGVPGVDIVIRR